MSNTSTQKQIKHGRDHWQAHIDAWQQSGQTRAAYCEQNNLNMSTFAYWRHRLKAESMPVKLVQIPTGPTTQPERSSLRIVFDDRFTIEVTDGFNPSTLARVIDVVRGL